MNWDNFAAGFEHFWNQPVPIIGFTVGTVIIGIIVILAKTSIGKKALNKMKEMFEDLKDKLHTAITLFKEYKENRDAEFEKMKQHYEQRIKDLTEESEAKIAKLEEKQSKMESFLLDIAMNNPNIRVKKALEEYKDGEE